MRSQSVPVQSQSGLIQNQQLSIHSQQISNANSLTNHIWSVPTQQDPQPHIQDQQGNGQFTNTSTQQVEPLAIEQS